MDHASHDPHREEPRHIPNDASRQDAVFDEMTTAAQWESFERQFRAFCNDDTDEY